MEGEALGYLLIDPTIASSACGNSSAKPLNASIRICTPLSGTTGRLPDPGELFRVYAVIDHMAPARELRPSLPNAVCIVAATADDSVSSREAWLQPPPI